MRSGLLFLFLTLSLFLKAQPTTVGTAFLDPQGCYTLTTNAPGQSGAVWFEDTLDLTKPFVIDTRVVLGSTNGGADGMTISLMANPGSSLGIGGRQLGYGGLTNAFAVEIDIYQNGTFANDPPYDHVAYHTGGSVIHLPAPSITAPVSALPGNGNIEDNAFHRAQLYWYPSTMQLDFYMDCSLRLSRTVDLMTILGVSEVQWGATAGTGGATATQRICREFVGQFGHDTLQTCQGGVQVNFSAPYIQTYQWSPTAGVSDPSSPNPVLAPFQTTTYTLTSTDSCGTLRHDTLTVEAFNGFNLLPPAEMICVGDSFQVDLSPYTNLVWSDGSTAGNRTFTQAGTYYVTVQDPQSTCSVQDSVKLFVADLNLQVSNQDVCYGDTTSLSANAPYAVYWSDFESGFPSGWSSADSFTYIFNTAAGPYRNDTVHWNLTGLPEHDQLEVEFTLYIFDTWDGNDLVSGPDLWHFHVDGAAQINTTFSNILGNQQSYPGSYQIDFPAFSGASHTQFPPRCATNSTTSVYQIQMTIPHSSCDAHLDWFGNLMDASGNPLCDESWALDNIVVRTNSTTLTSLCPPAFSWSNGATSTMFTTSILNTTTFVYTADFGSVICTDSVTVNRLGTPFDPFQDSVFICWDQQLTLNAGAGYASYLWSTGDTSQTIVTSAGGPCWVEAYDAFACLGRDTIWVMRTPEPFLRTDTTLCLGDPVTIALDTAYGPEYSVLWMNGSNANQYTGVAGGLDTLWVSISNAQLTCSDTLYIFGVDFELLDDTTIWCPNDPLLYSAPQGADSYLWSTGDTTSFTTFLAEGWYSVSITSGSCSIQDSVWHEWFQAYDDIVPDSTAECSPYALDLSLLPWTSMNVEPGGLTGSYIILDQNDTYYLSGTDINGCTVADTMTLWIGISPEVNLQVQENCPSTTFSYTVNDPTGQSGWSINGDSIPGTSLDTVIQGYEPLELAAWLINYCGIDSSFVTHDPGCFPRGVLYIPTAFTPNGDNVNDYFQPQGDRFQRFEMQLFNRWGELIYSGTHEDLGWDGRINGEEVTTTTVFVYRVRVWYEDGQIEEERGTLRLIR